MLQRISRGVVSGERSGDGAERVPTRFVFGGIEGDSPPPRVEQRGEGRLDDNGKRVPMNVRAGDRVLFAKYSGTEYKIDDVEYLILSEKDILGIIQE